MVKKIKAILLLLLILMLGLVVLDNIIRNSTSNLTVNKQYELSLTNKVAYPLTNLSLNKEAIKVSVNGTVHVSVDPYYAGLSILHTKNKYVFTGEVVLDNFRLVFDEKNHLVSTEIEINNEWVIYASDLKPPMITIDGSDYYLYTSFIHDENYNLIKMTINILNQNKVSIGFFTFERNTNN